MNRLIGYFDLYRDRRPKVTPGLAGAGNTIPWQFQYVALVLGILIEPGLTTYRQTQTWTFPDHWGAVAFAIVVGLIGLPFVYRKAFDEAKPMVVQLAPIFTSGIGWQSLVSGVAALGQGS
jgi:hypothetical protein